jgi:hypothetical protein
VSQAAPFASRFAHVESLCLRFDNFYLLYLHRAASCTLGECGSSRLEQPEV